MDYQEYKYLIQSDLYRLAGNQKISALIRNVLFGESYKYIFWMRTCRFLREKPWLTYSIYPIALLMLRHYSYKYGIGIPFTTEIGSGFTSTTLAVSLCTLTAR